MRVLSLREWSELTVSVCEQLEGRHAVGEAVAVSYEFGAAAAFGLMGMAFAIQDTARHRRLLQCEKDLKEDAAELAAMAKAWSVLDADGLVKK